MLTAMKALARGFRAATGPKLPVVCIFGQTRLALVTPISDEDEEKRLDCRCYASDADLDRILRQDRPDVLITIGTRGASPKVTNAPANVRRRWLPYDPLPDRTQLGAQAYSSYLTNLFRDPGPEDPPLVTVFTPTYRTGDRIRRPLQSLQEQTYTNWEWIVVDDSDDGGRTFDMGTRLAKTDHRIQGFKPGEHAGVIGKLKRWACSLGSGQILVELDHDDALPSSALDLVVRGFAQFPEAGFLDTDCAEIDAAGRNVTYRAGWAFGYGAYTDVGSQGQGHKSGSGGNINAKTIRHILSAPNHLRAWRKAVYDAIGSHNRGLHVAGDYELVVRTFLATRMARVPKLGYLQYSSQTAQAVRNGDIQRHVQSIRAHYDRAIDERRGCADYLLPNPPVDSHATLLATL